MAKILLKHFSVYVEADIAAVSGIRHEKLLNFSTTLFDRSKCWARYHFLMLAGLPLVLGSAAVELHDVTFTLIWAEFAGAVVARDGNVPRGAGSPGRVGFFTRGCAGVGAPHLAGEGTGEHFTRG
ncbi:hypothetical protein OsJ_16745 [Oryza sativa Japonica Group]|uniref:Uncharacterized protein n=1 Tax=Oryza sativa subsp. japonica TaxID=39947 RepID=B9FDR8_ORYSJ|nr:hypothetical protein OsJ_16745 [Oryza sativa Japonica Group]